MDRITLSPIRATVFALSLAVSLFASQQPVAAQGAPQPYPAQPAPEQAAPPPAMAPPPQQPPLAAPPPPPPAYGQQQPAYGQQQPAYGQPAPYTLSPAPRAPRPPKGMMITGASIFGGSYLVSAIIGVAVLDASESGFDDDENGEYDSGCDNCGKVGGLLLVPVLGPFLAMGPAEGGNGALALLGIVQTVGFGLMVGGIVRYKNAKRRYEEGGYAFDLSHGRSLSLDVGTTPAMLGPRMKLRF